MGADWCSASADILLKSNRYCDKYKKTAAPAYNPCPSSQWRKKKCTDIFWYSFTATAHASSLCENESKIWVKSWLNHFPF